MSNAVLSIATYTLEWLRDPYRICMRELRYATLAPMEFNTAYELGA
jgi:hypothetical protein